MHTYIYPEEARDKPLAKRTIFHFNPDLSGEVLIQQWDRGEMASSVTVTGDALEDFFLEILTGNDELKTVVKDVIDEDRADMLFGHPAAPIRRA